jgi:hypothetical protein
MSGFGSYPFGAGRFGHDPSIPSGPRGAFVPASPTYDGATGDFATDENGRRVSVHPVDFGVQMSMFVQQGELPNAPEIGNTLLQCRELGTSRQKSEVEGIIRRSNPIASYLANGSITITRIDQELRVSTGALLVAIHYTNNLTGRSETARNNAQ